MMDLIAIRPYLPNDENFIYSTALSGLYYGDSWFSKIKKMIFINTYREILKAILAKPTTEVRVACIKDDPDEIKGYCILVNNGSALMWVFVKKDWRKQGIAKALVPDTVTEVTNLTHLGEILIKKYPHVSFNPFIS
jgi:GNAT superfamily N-acetyltransferase